LADGPLAGRGVLIREGFGDRGRCDRTVGERLQAAPARVGDPLIDRAAVGAHDFLHGHAGTIGRSGAEDKRRRYVSLRYRRIASGTKMASKATIHNTDLINRLWNV
jgi:hypothetical protein